MTAAEIEAHLHLDESIGFSYIEARIAGAREWVEQYTGRRLVTQTTELQADGWGRDEVLSLRVAPVQSVDSVKYDDADDAEQTLLATEYWADIQSAPCRITIKDQWPSLQAGKPASVRVRMTTGYGAASAVPSAIKIAIEMIVGHLLDNREASSPVQITDVPMGVESLLEPYRLHRF